MLISDLGFRNVAMHYGMSDEMNEFSSKGHNLAFQHGPGCRNRSRICECFIHGAEL